MQEAQEALEAQEAQAEQGAQVEQEALVAPAGLEEPQKADPPIGRVRWAHRLQGEEEGAVHRELGWHYLSQS